ncbi:hypothetical protein [Nannocystis pusilla]|uniref:hypothetical protein n=1 Tax=Nannocystis pusilla TaxID=889268 RepID=UPI003DA50F35
MPVHEPPSLDRRRPAARGHRRAAVDRLAVLVDLGRELVARPLVARRRRRRVGQTGEQLLVAEDRRLPGVADVGLAGGDVDGVELGVGIDLRVARARDQREQRERREQNNLPRKRVMRHGERPCR